MARSAPRIPLMGDIPQAKVNWMTFIMDRLEWSEHKFVYDRGRDNHNFPIRHAGTASQEGVEPGTTRNMNPWFNYASVLQLSKDKGGALTAFDNSDYNLSWLNHTHKWHQSEHFPSPDPTQGFTGMFSWHYAGTEHDEDTQMYRVNLIPALVDITRDESINPSQVTRSSNEAWDTLVLSRLRFGVLIDPEDLVGDTNPELKKFVAAVGNWEPGDFVITHHSQPARQARLISGNAEGKLIGQLSPPMAWASTKGNKLLPTVQSVVSHMHALDWAEEHAGATIYGTEAKPAEASSDWVHTYCDKRKRKRVGITADVETYWHGYSRCKACNGEVEYRFDKGMEEATLKCPHCDADNGIVIQLHGVI